MSASNDDLLASVEKKARLVEPLPVSAPMPHQVSATAHIETLAFTAEAHKQVSVKMEDDEHALLQETSRVREETVQYSEASDAGSPAHSTSGTHLTTPSPDPSERPDLSVKEVPIESGDKPVNKKRRIVMSSDSE